MPLKPTGLIRAVTPDHTFLWLNYWMNFIKIKHLVWQDLNKKEYREVSFIIFNGILYAGCAFLTAHFVITHREIRECFQKLADDPECRSVVLSGAGKIFTTGKYNILERVVLMYVCFKKNVIVLLIILLQTHFERGYMGSPERWLLVVWLIFGLYYKVC